MRRIGKSFAQSGILGRKTRPLSQQQLPSSLPHFQLPLQQQSSSLPSSNLGLHLLCPCPLQRNESWKAWRRSHQHTLLDNQFRRLLLRSVRPDEVLENLLLFLPLAKETALCQAAGVTSLGSVRGDSLSLWPGPEFKSACNFRKKKKKKNLYVWCLSLYAYLLPLSSLSLSEWPIVVHF